MADLNWQDRHYPAVFTQHVMGSSRFSTVHVTTVWRNGVSCLYGLRGFDEKGQNTCQEIRIGAFDEDEMVNRSTSTLSMKTCQLD